MRMSIIPPTREQFDITIKEILGKLEYRHLNRDYTDLLERIRNSIENWLEKWLKNRSFQYDNFENISHSLSNGFIVATVILIVVVIIVIFLLLRKMVGKDTKVKKLYGEIIDEKTTAEILIDKSNNCKDNGDYRDAARYSFIALLVKLNEKNLLYLDETRTNNEMVQSLRKNRFKYIELFEKVVNLFNAVWYGHKPMNEDKFSSWESLMDVLWNEVMSIEKAK